MTKFKATRTQKTNWAHRGLGHQVVMPIREGERGHHITDKYVVGVPIKVDEEAHDTDRQAHRDKVLDWLKKNNRVLYLVCKSFEEDVWGDES